jgi:5,6-dimethylbenzimidazole synthase
MNKHRFNEAELAGVYRAIYQRRDMRHFRKDPVDPGILAKLLDAAHHGPSVGFMQPWRFIRITDIALRKKLHALVDEERKLTADALNERRDEFMKLKVEGILDCAEILVVALMPKREKHIFGRRTLPEMDLASVACAIQNLWLAARAEGLALGWVSLFHPENLMAMLDMPEGSQPVAILCLGHADEFYDEPLLQQENWAERANLEDYVMENSWKENRPLQN